ncbi:MAG: hypothetical protein R6X35_05200 [Candidatus Krumholzibacteriia bacterium]
MRHHPSRTAAWLLPLPALLAACEIADPQLPTFTTRLALPIGDARLDVMELVEDQDYLVALPDGTLGFTVAGDPDTVALDFDLGVDLPAQSLASSLGTFVFAPAAPAPFAFTLGGIYPPAALLDGTTTVVPPFSFATASDPAPVPDLESAHLTAGTLVVSVDNGLPVAVSGPAAAEPVRLRLLDPDTGTILAEVEFGAEIPAGGRATGTADLAGVVLPAQVAVELQGASPGSDGQPVTVDAQAPVTVTADFADVAVDAAEAVVGAQAFSTELVVDLPADYRVLSARIAAGAVTVSLASDLPIPCRATVTWPQVRTAAGDVIAAAVDLAAGGRGEAPVAFAGCTVAAGAEPLTALTAAVAVTSPGSDGAVVALQAAQAVHVDVTAGRLGFAEVTGEVPAVSFDLDPLTEAVDLPDELDGLALTAATLTLQVTNTAGVDAVADLLLEGTSAAGATASLALQETLAGYGEPTRGVTEIVRDETNSTIVAFLNNLPVSVSLGGTVTAGGPGQVGTVRPGDRATVAWRITAPVEVTIAGSVIHGDPEPLDLDADTRDLIRDRAGAAEVLLEIGNRLPVAIAARLLFGTDTTAITTAPLLAVGPVAVAAGVIDPVTYRAVAVTTSTPTVVLSAAEARLLAVPDLYAVVEVTLPGTGGQPARIMTSDYVTFRGLIRLDVEVSE